MRYKPPLPRLSSPQPAVDAALVDSGIQLAAALGGVLQKARWQIYLSHAPVRDRACLCA